MIINDLELGEIELITDKTSKADEKRIEASISERISELYSLTGGTVVKEMNSLSSLVIAEILNDGKYNRDAKGRFATINSLGSGKKLKAKLKQKQKVQIKKYKKVKQGFLDAKTRQKYLKDVTGYMKANGGITVALDSAKNMPKKGLSYSPYRDAEMIIPKTSLNEAKVLEFVKKNRRRLGVQKTYLGAWYNSDDGNYYLDVARVGDYTADTIAKAQKAEQLAVFDLATFNEISIGTRTKEGYVKNDKATAIYEQAFGNGNGRTVGETFNDTVRSIYAGTGRNRTEATKRQLVEIVVAEIRKDGKYNRNQKGQFATVNTLGAGHIKKIGQYKHDPKAPSKIANELGLNKVVSKERAEQIVKASMSKEAYAKYQKDLASMKSKMKQGKTTEEVYGIKFDAEGRATEYNLNRKKLHNEILFEYQKRIALDIKSSKPPKLLVIMGRPGSGKSSFENKGKNATEWAKWDSDKYLAIDPDEIKVLLGSKNNEVALYHEESSYLSKQVLAMATNLKANIAYDQTLASDKSGKILDFKKSGYDISATGVSTSVEVSLANAAKRYAEGIDGKGNTGRLVAPEVSLANTTNEANFEKVIPLTNGDWSYYVGQVELGDEFGFTEVASGR